MALLLEAREQLTGALISKSESLTAFHRDTARQNPNSSLTLSLVFTNPFLRDHGITNGFKTLHMLADGPKTICWQMGL